MNEKNELNPNNTKILDEEDILLIEKERWTSIGQLMGGIVHNLNTPLTGSVGQLMLDDRNIDSMISLLEKYNIPQNEYAEIINNMYTHNKNIRNYIFYMSDLVNTVKTYASENPNQKQNFIMKDIIDKVLLLTSFELKRNKIKLQYSISDEIQNQTIIGKSVYLVQILVNLIENSIHSYKGKKGQINININKNGEKTLEICIEDFGSGIKESIKSKLFKKMVTTKGSKGTGIGLYISNIMLKAEFNGKLTFLSELGKGTKMIIHIPL